MRFFPAFLLALAAIAVGTRYDFVFMPCGIDQAIVRVEGAVVQKSDKKLLVFKSGQNVYVWKKKSQLSKNDQSLGCYQFLHYRQADHFLINDKDSPF